jgi:hypothetical protein
MEMEMGKGKGYEYGGTGRWCESNEQMASGKKSVGADSLRREGSEGSRTKAMRA